MFHATFIVENTINFQGIHMFLAIYHIWKTCITRVRLLGNANTRAICMMGERSGPHQWLCTAQLGATVPNQHNAQDRLFSLFLSIFKRDVQIDQIAEQGVKLYMAN